MSRSFLSGGLNLNDKQLIKSIKGKLSLRESESFISKLLTAAKFYLSK